MKVKHISAILSAAFASIALLCSCSTAKDHASPLAYFSDLQAQNGTLPEGTSYTKGQTIKPDDELVISISSANPEASAMFNAPLARTAERGDVSTQPQPKLLTYIVGADGNITIPQIGVMHVQGLTTDEIASQIQAKVAETVKDPYVRVELLGWEINVMGEVVSPRRITVTKQKFSVLDALAAAGDLTEYAKRDGVIVIRDSGSGQKTYTRLNLQDSKLFASPCFYLQQDDVVYVEPNSIKVDNSKYNQNNAFKLSVVSTIVSTTSVIASLIIALMVK